MLPIPFHSPQTPLFSPYPPQDPPDGAFGGPLMPHLAPPSPLPVSLLRSPRWARSRSTAPSCSSTCCTLGTRGQSWGGWRRCPPQRWPPWPAAPPAAGFGTPSSPPPPFPPVPADASCASLRVTSSRWRVTATAAASSMPSGPRPLPPPVPPSPGSWPPSARRCSATPTAGAWPGPSPLTSSSAAVASGSGCRRPPTAAAASWRPSWRTDPPGGTEQRPPGGLRGVEKGRRATERLQESQKTTESPCAAPALISPVSSALEDRSTESVEDSVPERAAPGAP